MGHCMGFLPLPWFDSFDTSALFIYFVYCVSKKDMKKYFLFIMLNLEHFWVSLLLVH